MNLEEINQKICLLTCVRNILRDKQYKFIASHGCPAGSLSRDYIEVTKELDLLRSERDKISKRIGT